MHKLILSSIIIGIGMGLFGSLFLFSLQYVGTLQTTYSKLFLLLPLAGLLIVYIYQKQSISTQQGTNSLIHASLNGEKIDWKMGIHIFWSTLITHLVGGSAGREGTALQLGGSCAQYFTRNWMLTPIQQQSILIIGMSAGFSAVFGTPFTAFFFSFGVLQLRKMNWEAVIPAALSAGIAFGVSYLLKAPHSEYKYVVPTDYSFTTWGYIGLAGICFGLFARIYVYATHQSIYLFKIISNPYYRILIAATLLIISYSLFPLNDYMGLGLPMIQKALQTPMEWYVFLLKMTLTLITLSSGFKGGEVTPLFFMGACLGSFLTIYIPLDVSLLAATGFVAVFAGTTQTPLSCAVMGFEVFGFNIGLLCCIACLISYLISGNKSIYKEQPTPLFKVYLTKILSLKKQNIC